MTDEQEIEDGKVPALNNRFEEKVTGNAKADDPEIVQKEIAVHFFDTLGLRAQCITKKNTTKSPDFNVLKGNKKVFICEMKSLIQSGRVREDVRKALEERKEKGFEVPPGGCSIKVPHGNPKEPGGRSRISEDILKAIRQLKKINPDHIYPSVLLFCTFDRSLNVNDLAQLLCNIEIVQKLPPTFFMATESSRSPISLEASECGLVKCPDIDLFIWVEVDLVDYDMVDGKPTVKYFSYDPSAFFIWNEESKCFGQLLKCFSEELWPRWSCRQLYLCNDNEKPFHFRRIETSND